MTGTDSGIADENENNGPLTPPGVTVADEGESNAAPAPPSLTTAWEFGDRAWRAWQILRGRDIQQRVTVDPEVKLRRARASQELSWRRIYAFFLLLAMLFQITVADRYLWLFTEHHNWNVSDGLIIAFLSAVVVEVIGLVLVVTQSLFPRSTPSATPPRELG